MSFLLRSTAFTDGSPIPTKYTRDGDNLAPPLEWSDAPAGTRSYMLVVEDPDAPMGTFRHWGVYNIEAGRDSLPEAADATGTDGLGLAVNDFGERHYDGPAPPRGHGTHHYHFRLAALDVAKLRLPQNAKVKDVWRAAQGHVLGEAELVGTYERH
jgi:Raf kinase inhibitor-like YbhB/YbcL family protein